MTRAPIPLSERGRATRAPQRYIFGPRAEPPTRVVPGRRHYGEIMNQPQKDDLPTVRHRPNPHPPLDWERWVPGWEGEYSVTQGGDVISYKSGSAVMLNPRIHTTGYWRVNLSRRGIGMGSHYVHRLVAAAFLGDPTGLEVDHLDGDRTNARVTNLEIVTGAENRRRAPTVCGSALSRHLVEADIVSIRKRREEGEMLHEIAADYPVTKTAIGSICRRVTWRHVA